MSDQFEQTWARVQKAREKGRPTALDHIKALAPDFMELHGDRSFADDAAIIGGIGTFAGRAVTFIGHQKGKDLQDNLKRNFGMPNPEGYRKALRLMLQAEKFGRPVITFVDTPGAYPGIGAEERGQGEAIARNLMEMAGLRVPIITVVIGEGGSGGALALGVCDKLFMLENAIYSVLSPEGFATILWKDASRAKEAASLMKITAFDLKSFGIVDEVVDEKHGLHQRLAERLEETLKSFQAMSMTELLDARYAKFRAIGQHSEIMKP